MVDDSSRRRCCCCCCYCCSSLGLRVNGTLTLISHRTIYRMRIPTTSCTHAGTVIIRFPSLFSFEITPYHPCIQVSGFSREKSPHPKSNFYLYRALCLCVFNQTPKFKSNDQYQTAHSIPTSPLFSLSRHCNAAAAFSTHPYPFWNQQDLYPLGEKQLTISFL